MLRHYFTDSPAGRSAAPPTPRSLALTAKLMMILILTGSLSGIATAQEAAGWTYRFTPYLWAAGLKGSTAIGETQADIDLSFSDILDDLDMALMGDLRAENGPWAIESDVIWTDLKSEQSGRLLDITVEPRMVFWQLDGRYRVAPQWEVLAGLRYYYSKTSIRINAPNRFISASTSEDWVDPIIGVAFRTPINERWSFAARGDIGGFGIGSDFAWGALAVFDYRFGETTSLTFGYRHLDFDYEDDDFSFDAYMTGPIVGASFRF
jgi:hypothetical protein